MKEIISKLDFGREPGELGMRKKQDHGGEDQGLAGQGRSMDDVGMVGPQTSEDNQASYVGRECRPTYAEPILKGASGVTATLSAR